MQLSDEGGGIARSQLDTLFNYMYSTAPRPPSLSSGSSAPSSAPLVRCRGNWCAAIKNPV